MENKLELRVGDVVLLPVKVQSVNPGITCYGETPSKQNVAFAWHEVHSVIKRAETPEEELERLRAELAKAPRWIDWDGGEPPVDRHVRVFVRFRDGSYAERPAGQFDWSWEPQHNPYDVMSYMVLPQ